MEIPKHGLSRDDIMEQLTAIRGQDLEKENSRGAHDRCEYVRRTRSGTDHSRFDGSGYPSGIYWYVLQTPSQTLTRSMMLLK